jgi:hypothetical protein
VQMNYQERKNIQDAQKILYWSKIKSENSYLANFLEQSGLKKMIGFLNDFHIEIVDLYDENTDICVNLYDAYHFDLLFQRIRNHIKKYDGKRILSISHDDDPDWDCSGELFETEHELDLSKIDRIHDVLGLYTGGKVGTYASGCGFHHVQLKDELLDLIRNFVYDRHQISEPAKVLKLMGSIETEIDDENWDDVSDFICDNLFEDYVLKMVSYFTF